MIYTLTLNPAIDITINVKLINHRDVTRVDKKIKDAAGKGINVSKVIASLNGESTSFGFVAGVNGEFIKQQLDQLQIKHSFTSIEGETRENIKILETKMSNVIEINESGPTINDDSLQELTNNLICALKKDDILVIAGSIPPGVKKCYYKHLIDTCNEIGVITVLDTSLSLLESAIEGVPSVIKPNLFELEQLTNKTLKSDQDIINEGLLLNEKGIKHVIVTLGKKGSIYVSKEKVYKIEVPEIKAKSTVGAGDSFVGGFVYMLSNQESILDSLVYASSVASASCLTEGTKPGSIDDINNIKEKISIGEVNNEN